MASIVARASGLLMRAIKISTQAMERRGTTWSVWGPLTGQQMTRVELIDAVYAELDRAYAKHGREQWGRHEFYGILTEEYRELEEAIFTDAPQERVIAELVQVAAMCFRYFETGDRYRGTQKGTFHEQR